MRNLVLVLVFAAAAPAGALQVEKMRVAKPLSAGGGSSEVEVVSGQALARFDPTLNRAGRESALKARGFRLGGGVAGTDWWVVAFPTGMSVQGGMSILTAVSGVIETAPNHFIRPNRVPSDPNYSSQYHLGKINAPAAWEYGVGGSTNITVAVIDSGIEATHPDLSGKLVNLNQFCDPVGVNPTNEGDDLACVGETPVAACNHGTRVAGVAAAGANNGVGGVGVSWGAKLLSVRVFRVGDCTTSCGDNTSNGCGTDDTAIANAIHKVTSFHGSTTTGRIVANLSLGYLNVAACPALIQTAINTAVSSGVVVVVAGGNEGGAMRPLGNCANVIPVGATDANDNIANFSNSGAELASNGVVAPGVSIFTTDINGGTTNGANGTSFSAPMVAGIAALMIDRDPSLTVTQVKDKLRASAESIGVASISDAFRPGGNSAGAGRVNAFRAMKLVADGTLAGFAGDEKVIAFPNPFRTQESGSVTITIPSGLAGKNPKIKIYTIDGQLVRDLHAQTTWDAKNDHGHFVATGVYLVLVKTDSGSQTARVAVIR